MSNDSLRERMRTHETIYARTLKDAGLRSQADLLETGGTIRVRKDPPVETGISEAPSLLAQCAGLVWITGDGDVYADIIPELAQEFPANLHSLQW